MIMKRFCFALDLKDDPRLIEEYKEHHKKVWPEILKSITDSGIKSLEIYNVQNRLFMIMDTHDDFSLESKKELDDGNPKVEAWEKLMWKYQQALPQSKPGEKWMLMEGIFKL